MDFSACPYGPHRAASILAVHAMDADRRDTGIFKAFPNPLVDTCRVFPQERSKRKRIATPHLNPFVVRPLFQPTGIPAHQLANTNQPPLSGIARHVHEHYAMPSREARFVPGMVRIPKDENGRGVGMRQMADRFLGAIYEDYGTRHAFHLNTSTWIWERILFVLLNDGVGP